MVLTWWKRIIGLRRIWGAVLLVAFCVGIFLSFRIGLMTEIALADSYLSLSTEADVRLHQPDLRLDSSPASSTMGVALYLPLLSTSQEPTATPEPTALPTPSTPNTPFYPLPVSGAVNQSPNTYLKWSVFKPSHEPLRFELYLDVDNPNPQTLRKVMKQMSYDPATLERDRDYYWKIVVIDDLRHRVEGPVWSFHTEPLLEPPVAGSMIVVPAGQFYMGCLPTDGDDRFPCLLREQPLHPVYLDAYAIDRYEVTNREYRACVDAGVCQPPRRFNSRARPSYFDNPEFDLYPVVYVSWWDARTYCGWAGKRLLTEAEWEKAGRGTVDLRRWPWGDEPPRCTYANHSSGCVGDTARIGSFPAGVSPYGVYDMAGNVFEWVKDWYDDEYYERSPYYNPQGSGDGSFKLIRGGSHMDNSYYTMVTHRHYGHHGDYPYGDAPFYRSARVGIRCGQSLP